jgi:hypothetical protein
MQEPFSTILERCFLIYGGRWTRQCSRFRKMQTRDLAVVQVERVANDDRKRFRASVIDCSSRSFSSSFERGCPSWTACSRACSSRTGHGAASAMLNSN